MHDEDCNAKEIKQEKQVVEKVQILRNRLGHLTEAIVILEKELSTVLRTVEEVEKPIGIDADLVPLASDLDVQNDVVDRLIIKIESINKRLEV